MKLKPIAQQIVVIVGASSGIGRETALRFAKKGAKVVVAARSQSGLETFWIDRNPPFKWSALSVYSATKAPCDRP
jgi:NADP-dependent 3-hydroxy acid dehydrogenase YdfG